MRIALASLAVVLVVSGCGYKGPLYLPKPKPAAAQKPAPSPAAVPAKSDDRKAGDDAVNQ